MKAWTHVHVYKIMSNLSLQKWQRISSSKLVTSSVESLTQTAALKSASHPASLLPWFAESPSWCCVMPTERHDAHRPSPQRWVSLGGEWVRAAKASHWESALDLKGTFWRGRSEKWVFCFGWTAQLQMRRRRFSANVTTGWLYSKRRSYTYVLLYFLWSCVCVFTHLSLSWSTTSYYFALWSLLLFALTPTC